MKEKDYCWRALWLTEGSAALAVKEDVTEGSEQCDIRVYKSADERNAASDTADSARGEERAETEVPRERERFTWEEKKTAAKETQDREDSAREGERTEAGVPREREHFAREEKKIAAKETQDREDSAREEEEHPEDMPYSEDEEEMPGYDRLSIGGKLMCGMAALLEEYLLLLVTGIQAELTPLVTLLFIWVTLAVISAEAVKLSAGQ